ncbi:MAG: hypothetical protein EA359_06930 [Balneolaceae bacterium]|nr:MAG: hypothetical protein EA359_06930 [Balneolaceae bacterium]
MYRKRCGFGFVIKIKILFFAISYQLSAISYQLSAISYQPTSIIFRCNGLPLGHISYVICYILEV